ncbi:MAG TPA: hypothetical protein VJU77_13235 [Chthoniobacterales bacterium]|nr:hypothetical protein [Chthoniobacterales bacterium]
MIYHCIRHTTFLTVIVGLGLTLALAFQRAEAQSAKKVPAKEASLIAHLVKEANHPDSHGEEDFYLVVTIGKTEYTAELASGRVVSQSKTENPSGGFAGAYAEVGLSLMHKDKRKSTQSTAQILKLRGTEWKRVALSEGDYQCEDLKGIPKSILKALKVECN